MTKPVIAVAGLGCENSTFTPSRTTAADFHPKRGAEAVQQYHFLRPGSPLAAAADWHGALVGRALPGGMVTSDAFETLSAEIIARLKDVTCSTHLDGLWYDIHGAMHVEGILDVEAELLRRIRTVIEPDVVVSASMDLHGNVSRELAHQVDLITCYRMAPHEDELDTKERACRNLVSVLTNRERGARKHLPIKAWIPLPILLPGEQTSTRDEPAKHIYAAVSEVEAMPDVLDAAIWVGYAWGDEVRNRAIVMVTGWTESAVRSGAEKLAQLFWNARRDFKFVAPTGTLDECLDAALASSIQQRPYYISDSGDNPTAGGSGNVTWSLNRILQRPDLQISADGKAPVVIYASIPAPEAVSTAFSAGLGTEITIHAGAAIDNIHCGPLTLTGTVHSLHSGDRHAVREAVIVIQYTNIHVILTQRRKPYHKEVDFRNLRLDPRNGADVVVVKIGYLEPDLYDMQKGWMLALTPGGVDQELKRLGHVRIRRPMWGFDGEEKFADGGEGVDLRARIIEGSWEELSGVDE